MALTARYVTASGTDTYANSTNSATPMSLTTAFANMAAGDEIWIKAGNYTARTADTPTNDGSGVSPIVLHGYNSTIGDLDAPTYNTDGSLVTTNYPVIEYNAAARLNASGSTLIVYRNLKIGVAGAGFSGAALLTGANCVVHQCYIYNPSTNAAATALTVSTNSIVENCDLALTGASGGLAALSVVASCRAIGNRIIDSQIAGISMTAAAGDAVILNNVFFAAVVGPCIDSLMNNASLVFTVIGNTMQGKGIGFRSAAVSFVVPSYFGNNHVTDMSTAAFLSSQDGTAQICGVFSHNRFRDNVANIDGWDDWAAGTSFAHVTTDTGGPETDYTDVATNQYRLIAGAPGAGTASVVNRDIGALQRAAGTGGGLSRPVPMNGGTV